MAIKKKLNNSLEYDINKFKYLFLVALSKLKYPTFLLFFKSLLYPPYNFKPPPLSNI